MAAIQDLVLTFCPNMHCFTTKETETLDACIETLDLESCKTLHFMTLFSSSRNSSTCKII